VVLHVLYLVFNEGYTTSSGPALQRTDLTAEAVRLTRLLDGDAADRHLPNPRCVPRPRPNHG
jgi:predicted RNA polymerase sigma factor